MAIDSHLTFERHLSELCKIVNRKISFLSRLRKHLSFEKGKLVLKHIESKFHSLNHSLNTVSSFECFIGDKHVKSNKQTSQKVPKKYMRIVTLHLGQSIQVWTRWNLWKTAFKKFDVIKFFESCVPQISLGPFLNICPIWNFAWKRSHLINPSSKYTLFTKWNFQGDPRFDWQWKFKPIWMKNTASYNLCLQADLSAHSVNSTYKRAKLLKKLRCCHMKLFTRTHIKLLPGFKLSIKK